MMVRVNITRDREGFIWNIIMSGHAGYAKKGSDIVCAAVSAIAYTAAGALGELAGIKDCYREKDGYMEISIPLDIAASQKNIAKTILETAAIGFKQIEMEYGDYVSVLDEEV